MRALYLMDVLPGGPVGVICDATQASGVRPDGSFNLYMVNEDSESPGVHGGWVIKTTMPDDIDTALVEIITSRAQHRALIVRLDGLGNVSPAQWIGVEADLDATLDAARMERVKTWLADRIQVRASKVKNRAALEAAINEAKTKRDEAKAIDAVLAVYKIERGQVGISAKAVAAVEELRDR